MTLTEVLGELAARSVQIRKTGNDLKVRARDEGLDPSLVAQLRAHKAALLELLADGEEWWSPPPVITPAMLPLVDLTQEEIDRIVAAVPGGASNVQDIYPLAPLQEGLLFHHLLAADSDPYLLARLFSFDGRPRLDAFLDALQSVVDRHDILRTAVCWEGLRIPVQVVWRKAPLVVEEVLVDETADAAQSLSDRFGPGRSTVDVRQAPMLRAWIAYDAARGRWALLLLSHHLLGDHSTMQMMVAEIRAFLAGHGDRLPRPLPFRNFIAQVRQGVTEQEHQAFFTRMVGDVTEPTTPYGLVEVQGDGNGIAETRRMVDADVSRRLRDRARKLGVSTASLCHLAWALVLARVSRRQDVVFGTVLFGRMQGGEGADRVMGLFMNTLPMRIDVGAESVEAGARRTHNLLAELLYHEHASLALAQQCSGVKTPLPLFSALLNYRHQLGGAEEVQANEPDVWEGIEDLHGEERTNYPFALSIDDFGDRLGLEVQVQASLDPERVCALMETALEQLADALESAPGTPLCQLDVLPDAERRVVIGEWNETAADYPAEACVHELFEAHAAKAPEALALIDGARQFRYGELNRRANELAHHLLNLGIAPDDRLALCIPRSAEAVVAILAVLKAGGAYVPLDPATPPERLAAILDDCAPRMILTNAGSTAGVRAIVRDRMDGRFPILNVDLHDGAQRPRTNPTRSSTHIRPRNLAYLIYTSGSTGAPKAVMIEHQSLCNQIVALQARYAMTAGDRMLQFAAITFDMSVEEIFPALTIGASLVLRNDDCLSGARAFWDFCARNGVTQVNLPTRFWQLLSEESTVPIPPAVRLVVIGGEAVQKTAVAAWFERAGHRPRLFNGYGPTEATVNAAIREITEDPSTWLSIGRPVANTAVYLLDDRQRPVPIGVAGELHVGGVQVARGYLNRVELTAEKFTCDSFGVEGGRLYRTGDLARFLSDGNIEFLGRDDFQVKIRGFRIELGEVESRLAEHPLVETAVVIAAEDPRGDKRLIAYVVTVDGQTLQPDELRRHVAARLPDYMVPAAYVRLDALPLSSNGKLDRGRLPAGDGDAFPADEYEPPRGRVETLVADLWKDLLSLDRVGRNDHFFELGGHSLLAVRLISRLRAVLDAEVALSAVFANPILADFAMKVVDANRTALPPVTPAPLEERGVLSFAQQRLWFLGQLDSESIAYHIPSAFALHGDLDLTALRDALDRLVLRHEVLRTTYVSEDGEPRQRIGDGDWGFTLREHDLTGHAEPDLALQRLADEEATAPFDLEQGPLIRGRLIRTAPREHTLLITQHHIVSDAWSMGVMLTELSALYAAYCAGEPDPLPPLPVQYADYAAWQRRWITGEVLQEQADYWKSALSGAPALLELPTDRPRPAQQDFTGGSFGFTLEPELTGRLRELSRRHGTTLFMTLLASWAAVLARLSGQDEVVLGTPTANRGRAEIEGLIGFFVNTLALRVDVSGASTVADLLARVKAQTIAAQQHQDIPFEQVVELLRPARSLSHSPLFQVLFAWESGTGGALELPGLQWLPGVRSEMAAAKFDLSIVLSDADGVIGGGVSYASALFDRATVERYVGHWRTLLEAMTADETRPVHELPLLTSAELGRIVEQGSATRDYRREECIHELFETQAAKTPHAVALLFEGRPLTYGDLNRRANQLAHALIDLGVQPDDRVALYLERGPELVVALLAVLKAGGAYVPIDPAYPAERVAHMLQDSAPVVVITQSAMPAALPGQECAVIELDTAEEMLRDRPDGNPRVEALRPEHLAYIIYTSGSTGKSKGVMVEHRNVTRLFAATDAWFGFNADDTWTLFHSYAFDFSVWEIWGALLYGGRLVIVPREVSRSPEDFYRLLSAERVTVLNQTPSAFRQLISAQGEAGGAHHLRYVIFGGEALDVATLTPWFARNGDRTSLVNMYGITETTVHVTYRPIERADTERRGGSPIGSRIPDLSIYVLDAHGRPVPVGVIGELHVGGAGVARGYLNRPALTAERFLRDPFQADPGARMYRTGDLARWLPDGELEFLGRNDFQVKIRGFRIELGEIESRLVEFPAVRQAIVLAKDSGDGDRRLVAYVVTDDDPSAESLRAHLAATLPDYMLPAAYVTLRELPLTQNGKVNRDALPDPGRGDYAARLHEEPAGETETIIAAIWKTLLRLDSVGRHDNFFELGGHSFLAVALVERMRRHALRVDVHTVFLAPTVAGLAAAAGSAHDAPQVPPNRIPARTDRITPEMLTLTALDPREIARIVATVPGGAANVQDIYPLAPLQEGILFHHLAGSAVPRGSSVPRSSSEHRGSSEHRAEEPEELPRNRGTEELRGTGTAVDPYVLCNVSSIDGRERLDAYIAALQAVVDRHDILRTAVVWKDLPEPLQVVWRHATVPVQELVFDGVCDDVALEMYRQVEPRQYRFDLERAPLVRLWIARDERRRTWLVLMLMHQMVIDHGALEVVQREIQAHMLGCEALLPPPQPFRTFIAQARLGIAPKEHEAFFREMLGDVHEPTAPFGLLEVQGDGTGTAEARLMLDSESARRVREVARGLGVSAASVFHVAWAQVLARVAGRDDVVFGTVLFGRTAGTDGAEGAVGMFINTLPLRVNLGDRALAEVVRATHHRLADLMRHQHASLPVVQRSSAVPAGTPLFSSLFNYRHSGALPQMPADANVDAEAMEGLDGIHGLYSEERTNYPLVLAVDDFGEEFALTAQIQGAVEPAYVCELMRTALDRLAAALTDDPTALATSVDVLPAFEHERLIAQGNQTAAGYPGDRCVHELFEAQVERSPDAIAVADDHAALTYRELNARANQLAHHLRLLGIGPDDRVAICVDRGVDMMIGLLAILKAGGAYVPLDPSHPTERLHSMLEDSTPKVLLTQERFRERFVVELAMVDVGSGRRLAVGGRREQEPAMADGTPWVAGSPANRQPPTAYRPLAYVIYTSGSTGRPKGVMVEHRGVVNLLVSMSRMLEVGAADHVLALTTIAFDIAGLELFLPLLSGGRTTLVSRNDASDPDRLAHLIATHAPTIVQATPATWRMLVDGGWTGLPRLRAVCGGEALPVDLAMSLIDKVAVLWNVYGPTETTIWSSAQRVDRGTIRHETHVPIGGAIANTRIYLLDGRGRPVPAGVAGEIHIAGDGVARGYLNRAELTAEKFVRDPFSADPAARMYRTGDLGRALPDGSIVFLGRNDHQVKIRGFRIELGEIEARLREHPAVGQAVVIARTDGNGDPRLVAYWTLSPDASPSIADRGPEELRAHLSIHLPDYMLPASFVLLETMPLTANGKLDRAALPAPGDSSAAAPPYEPPRNAAEEIVAEAWGSVLERSRVGRNDNVFELGAHSLQTLRVVNLIRRKGIDISVADVFTHPTVASLAASIDEEPRLRGDQAIAIRTAGRQQPLFLVHEANASLFYAHALAPFIDADVPLYGLPPVHAGEPQLRTVEGMAARLVAMIRAVQPDGPYRIAGWSFGGTIAYEIATQLLGVDEKIEFLGVIDTDHIPDPGREALPELDDRQYLLAIADAMAKESGDARARERLQELEQLPFELLLKQCGDAALLPGHLAGLTPEEARPLLERERSLRIAASQYVAHPIPIPITVFRASERDSEPFLGWDSVVPQADIRAITVNGTHHSILQAPNIEILGLSLSAALAAPSPGPGASTAAAESPLVVLQSGRGMRDPLVCVPGAGANVVSFAELAAAMDRDLPIYGLQPRGLDGVMVPHASVHAAAVSYLEAVGQASLLRPLHLFGHSFGGWVVLEMAHLLRAAGRRIASVTIVDSEVPGEQPASQEFDNTSVIMQLVEIFEQMLERPLGITAEEMRRKSQTAQRQILHQRLTGAGILPKRSTSAILLGPVRVFGTCVRTSYAPGAVYDDLVRLVVLDDPRLDAGKNRELQQRCVDGWRRWAPALEVWHGPGNHMTAFSAPHVHVVTNWWRENVS